VACISLAASFEGVVKRYRRNRGRYDSVFFKQIPIEKCSSLSDS
jgi:hypothetical protein